MYPKAKPEKTVIIKRLRRWSAILRDCVLCYFTVNFRMAFIESAVIK